MTAPTVTVTDAAATITADRLWLLRFIDSLDQSTTQGHELAESILAAVYPDVVPDPTHDPASIAAAVRAEQRGHIDPDHGERRDA